MSMLFVSQYGAADPIDDEDMTPPFTMSDCESTYMNCDKECSKLMYGFASCSKKCEKRKKKCKNKSDE